MIGLYYFTLAFFFLAAAQRSHAADGFERRGGS
jgi:hypothetical protein